MNVSKFEQRVLHALAQGGHVRHHKDDRGDIVEVDCITRDGYRLGDCTLPVFQRLKRRRLIASSNRGPYRITSLGLGVVRAQANNR
jgi:uncharacterized protein YjhX (UPF0386 family)